MLERPIDERGDAVWGYATTALAEMFDQVEQRLKYLEEKSKPSPL
jgi:hypothetical protein